MGECSRGSKIQSRMLLTIAINVCDLPSKHRPTNKIVAVKIVDVDASDYEVNARDNDGAFHKFMNETSILKTLKERKARNVNLIHDAFTFDQDVWIVSEYCPGGSVHTLVSCYTSYLCWSIY